ncbi:MAG: PEGA domain-containing protein [bacterium]|nr:hypothetical protein [Deltaproteobacteria bacterium]MCP4903697.1 PEGA domain-containing protein [bacterium]
MTRTALSVVLSFSVLLTGCASMFNGSSQQVAIRSNVDGAEIYVNEAYLGKGNAVTTFKKKENYVISARREGCDSVSLPAPKSFDATTLLGIFLDFGIITILVIDGVATGAWQQFDQTSYVVDPQCT